MNRSYRIDYIEFPSTDLAASKTFFSQVFGWRFRDYGPEYSAFSQAGVMGGFFQVEASPARAGQAALVVLYSSHLESTLEAVQQAGGEISRPVFTFPGGRRFHFIEPGGNELAVWSEREAG